MHYKKTKQGQAEIEGSERRLPQRLRMVLVLVDGKRSAAELQQLLASATPDALQALADDGYITPAAVRRPSSAPRPPATPPAQAADDAFQASAMPSHFDVASRPREAAATDKEREQIARSLRRALGSTADSLIATVGQARTVRELVEVLKSAQRAIANARGKEIADEFASRYGSLDEL